MAGDDVWLAGFGVPKGGLGCPIGFLKQLQLAEPCNQAGGGAHAGDMWFEGARWPHFFSRRTAPLSHTQQCREDARGQGAARTGRGAAAHPPVLAGAAATVPLPVCAAVAAAFQSDKLPQLPFIRQVIKPCGGDGLGSV